MRTPRAVGKVKNELVKILENSLITSVKGIKKTVKDTLDEMDFIDGYGVDYKRINQNLIEIEVRVYPKPTIAYPESEWYAINLAVAKSE